MVKQTTPLLDAAKTIVSAQDQANDDYARQHLRPGIYFVGPAANQQIITEPIAFNQRREGKIQPGY
jgi:hypothetical protein